MKIFWIKVLGVIGSFILVSGLFATPAKPLVMRKPSTPCGLYLGVLGDNGRPSRITGRKVADLTPASLDHFFESHPDLEARLVVVGPGDHDAHSVRAVERHHVPPGADTHVVPQVLFIVGAPWPKKEWEPLQKQIEERVAGLRLHNPPDVQSLRRPSSDGIRRLWEETAYLAFPQVSDWSRPTREELKQGAWSVAMSSGITIPVQSVMQGPEIGLPAGLMNMAFSLSTSLPRPLWGNFYSKHEGSADNWAKQLWMTSYFTAGVYWAGKLFQPELASIATPEGWATFIMGKWNSILFGTLWRKPMEHGLSDFISEEAKRGVDHEKEARRIAATIRKIGTITNTNLWLISVFNKEPLFHFVTDWNIGHIGMVASAVVFYALSKHPEWYRIIEKDFRVQKRAEIKVKLKDWWDRMRGRAPAPPSENPPPSP